MQDEAKENKEQSRAFYCQSKVCQSWHVLGPQKHTRDRQPVWRQSQGVLVEEWGVRWEGTAGNKGCANGQPTTVSNGAHSSGDFLATGQHTYNLKVVPPIGQGGRGCIC